MISPLQKKGKGNKNLFKMDEYDEAVNQFKILERAEEKKDIFEEYFSYFKS